MIDEEKMGFTEAVEQPKLDHIFVKLETSETGLDKDNESVSDNTYHDVQEETMRQPQRERRPDY